MAKVRTTRRRVRQVPTDVLRAIHQELLTGASAPEVVRSLERRVAKGEFPADAIPSERTVSNIAREARSNTESGIWSMSDGDPATVGLVLRVLGEVVRRTEGRVAALTVAEAALLPVIHRAMEPRWTKLPTDAARAWQAYVWTRFYLSWVRSEQDAHDVALMFAALQTDGRWPITRLAQIDRVLIAAHGWLPPELIEVKQ